MRRNFIYILILFLVSAATFAQDPNIEKYINEANELYQNEKYSEAIDLYRKVINEGYESVPLYYNLANSYYRDSKLGMAVLFYERALKIDPTDEDVIHNLKIVKAHTVDKFEEVPQLFLVTWWNSIVNSLTVQTWAVIVIVSF